MGSAPFAALVDRLVGRLRPVPIVTPDAYRAIACNRCGLCCEDIPAPYAPEELATMAVDPALTADKRRFLAGLEPVGPEAAARERYHIRRVAPSLEEPADQQERLVPHNQPRLFGELRSYDQVRADPGRGAGRA